jgi:hypothetical protein
MEKVVNELNEKIVLMSNEIHTVYDYIGKLIERINSLEKQIGNIDQKKPPLPPARSSIMPPDPGCLRVKLAPTTLAEEAMILKKSTNYFVEMERKRNERQNWEAARRLEEENMEA